MQPRPFAVSGGLDRPYVTQLERLFESSDRLSLRNELVTDETLVARRLDRAHDGG